MPQKVILVADPGIDTAFAIAIALHDPRLDVLGLLATAGNVSAAAARRAAIFGPASRPSRDQPAVSRIFA